MSETTLDTRQGMSQDDVDELLGILEGFSESAAEATLEMLGDTEVPVVEQEGESSKDTLLRIAQDYPAEVAVVVLFAALAEDLFLSALGL